LVSRIARTVIVVSLKPIAPLLAGVILFPELQTTIWRRFRSRCALINARISIRRGRFLPSFFDDG